MSGDAGQGSGRNRGRWWRWPGTALILLVEAVLLTVAIGGTVLAWRAAQGPVDLSLFLPRIGRAAAVAAPRLDVSVGHLAVAWKGFTNGPGQPIRVTGAAIAVADPKAHRRFTLDRMSLDLSAAWAVRGVLAPRGITLVGPALTMRRGMAPGSASPSSSGKPPFTVRDVMAVLERPAETDGDARRERPAALSDMMRVQIIGGQLLLEPPASASAPAIRIGAIAALLTRAVGGGVTGHASGVLSTVPPGRPAAAEEAHAAAAPTLSASLAIGTTGILRLRAGATLDDPAALMAAIVPPASGVPVLAMPMRVTADVTTDSGLSITALKATLGGGAGKVLFGGATLPVSGFALGVSGDLARLALDPGSHIAFGAVSGQPPPTLGLGGSAQLGSGGMTAMVTLGVDHVATDDLPAYWPPQVAAGARAWIAAQVHDGLMQDGAFALGLSSGPGFEALAVTTASGGIQAQGLTVAWLPPLPPLTQVRGSIALHGPDAIGVTVTGANQTGGPPAGAAGDLHVGQGKVMITGLTAKEQIGAIAVHVTGPVATALALLNQPRLHLLKTVPVPLRATAGTITTDVAVTLPLDARVTFAQIQAKVHAQIQGLALADVLLGRGVSDGQLTIDADPNQLHLSGTAALAAIPTQFKLDVDLGAGPPAQIIARLDASATADQAALGKAGIPTGGVLNGAARLAVALTATRGGRTDVTIRLALPEAYLRVTPISWAGGGGQATATAHLALQGPRIVALDDMSLNGPDTALDVRSAFAGGRLSTLFIDRLRLGRTDLRGSLGFPATKSDPYVLAVHGPMLDLSNIWGGRKPQPSVAPANDALSTISSKAEFRAHPPWRAEVDLDRILFGTLPNGAPRALDNFKGLVVNDGVVVRSAQIAFTAEPSHSRAHLSIVPDANGTRIVTLTSGNVGGLLKAINAYDLVSGGALRIDGTYDDRLPDHPLNGICEMDSFTLGDAPTVAKALAAMTLYGVVDLLHGPGLFFRKLIMPFDLADRRLQLTQARAYSASLGLTAHGSVDLPNNRFDLMGTIVPAYFFNSLLGRIPLIGKYFSPEKGGGVFAATYELVGPIDDPAVHVNPLSLITPGFLRGVFGD